MNILRMNAPLEYANLEAGIEEMIRIGSLSFWGDKYEKL